MTDLLEPETGQYGDNEFKIFYTGMPDGRELKDLIHGDTIEAPGSGKLYFTVSETQALNDYVLSRRLNPDFHPVVLETWFPEDRGALEEWTSGAEFTADSYPVQNIRGYTDLRTGKFVEHGEGREPGGVVESLRYFLGIEKDPEYLLPEETEFHPLRDW